MIFSRELTRTINYFQHMTITNINSETLKNWLKNNETVVIDVREPLEYEAQYIEGSTLMPLDTVSLDKIPQSEGKKLVIHCLSGKRSLAACNKLLSQDPNIEIYNLEGGILAWVEAGNDCKSKQKTPLSIERQTQLLVGLFVLVGSILGYFANPVFMMIPMFFGAGLLFASLTGSCTLGKCLSKMPWNNK